MATTTQQLDPVLDLEAAEAFLSAVRARIGSSDPTVTVSDLERAEAAVRFARMRVEASIEYEADQREQARRDRVAEIRASLPVIFDTTVLNKARQDIEAALDAYCAEAGQIDRGFSDVYNELIRMPRSGISVDPSAHAPSIGGYRKPNFSGQVTATVTEAFRRHGLTYEQGRNGR